MGFECCNHLSPRDPEPGDNVLPCEALDLFLDDGGRGFGFNPLREVVDPHYKEASLSRSRRKRSEEVKPPLGERLGYLYRGKWDCCLVSQLGVPLTLLAPLHI